MKDRKIFIKLLTLIITLVIIVCTFDIVIDPYFHFHKPLSFLAYPIEYQRYQNNGIMRNFDYDAVIAGTSMTENFKASEFDNLFKVNSVKIPDSGGSYKEINDEVKEGFNNGKQIKIVIRGLDYSRLFDSKDTIRYDASLYPNYLYDDKYINDIKYVLNKNTLLSSISVIINTLIGNETTTFDEYSNWMDGASFGKEAINYKRKERTNGIESFTNEEKKTILENLEGNVVSIVKEYPSTQFYYFFTPYSIYYFDNLFISGELQKQLEAEEFIIKELIKYDNIHLFSFFNDYEIICDLNNYKDTIHYSEDINTYILECMKNGTNEINGNNFDEYCKKEQEFYLNFDYDAFYDSKN